MESELPSYYLDSEKELTKINKYDKKSKINELFKTIFQYLDDIPEEILTEPKKIGSTGEQVRYLYNDKYFDLKNKIKNKDYTYTPTDINKFYNDKCAGYEQEEIKNIKKIIVIGDIHGDYKMLLYILKKHKIIIPAEKSYKRIVELDDKDVAIRDMYKDKKISDRKVFEFEYELNPSLKDIIVIQLGDQLTGYRAANTQAYKDINYNPNEDEKVLMFMTILKEQSKKLNKEKNLNVHIISLIGNHEFTNLRGIYSKCSHEDSSCIDYYTSPDLRVDRRAFIKHELKNILCGRDYFFSYNGFVFAHCGLINSLIVRLDAMFPHLNIIKNLKQLKTLDEKIDYYNKLIKLLVFIKVEKIKDDDITLIKEKKIYNSIDKKILADIANSKEAINNGNHNIENTVQLFHLNNMIVAHEMIYDGIKKVEYQVKIDGEKTEKVNVYNLDTGLSNSFFNRFTAKDGKDEEGNILEGKPKYGYIDRITTKFVSPAKNNQLLKQIMIIEFDDDNKVKDITYDTIEHIKFDEPYINYLYVNPEYQTQPTPYLATKRANQIYN